MIICCLIQFENFELINSSALGVKVLINLSISSCLLIYSDFLINSTSLLASAHIEFHSSGLSINEEQASKKLTFRASDFN